AALGPIDAAVVGEPTGLEVCVAQRGMLLLRCVASGRAAHAAHAELGANAVHAAARDIVRLASMRFGADPFLGETRAQVTRIEGGRARNQVPDACEFTVDLRTSPGTGAEAIVGRLRGELESEVLVHSARYLPCATDEGHAVVRAALAAAGRTRGVGSRTTSDWAFLSDVPAGKVGPGDTTRSHRPDEYLTRAELLDGVAFYRRFVPDCLARLAAAGGAGLAREQGQ
ncbi:MAG TPA: M20/M25/M40 family metallo-hydrolase, partial [Vicinamibacterales bacterium]|nr:M20/M25/M40 family metallo-hydrolase [Vicinamibacterales bacterium]